MQAHLKGLLSRDQGSPDNEEDSDERVFTRNKTNITIEGGGFHYTIEAVPLHSNIVGRRVVWGGAIEGSSRSILSSIEGDDILLSGRKSEEARNFLYLVLGNGPVTVAEVKAQYVGMCAGDSAVDKRILHNRRIVIAIN